MRLRRPCNGLALRRRRVHAERADDRVEPPDLVGAVLGSSRVVCVDLARAALVDALATFPPLAPGGHLSVELPALALAMAHDATMMASAVEAARRCISAAAALAALLGALAAAPRRGAAPGCRSALAGLAALSGALALSLAQGVDGLGQGRGASPVAFELHAAALSLKVPDHGVRAGRVGDQGAHQHVASRILAPAAAGEGQHLGAAAGVLHLRPDPSKPGGERVQLGSRDEGAQELQREELLQRG